MRVVVRVDSSYQIGSGHLMRCLTLAELLRARGATVVFVCRELPGHVAALVKDRDFALAALPSPRDSVFSGEPRDSYANWLGVDWQLDAAQTKAAVRQMAGSPDWLVVDHYALDSRWEELLAAEVGAVLVIDDLANRQHRCRVLLDHNLSPQGEARYLALVPNGCLLLCGPRYALLRPEFEVAAAKPRERDGTVKRLLIFFGGVDATGETLKACEAIAQCGRDDLQVDVVVGVANPRRKEIHEVCEGHPMLNFHGQVSNIAELMAAADLAIGAGGTTTWERAFLGLPSIVIPVAENQVPGTVAMAAAGAIWNLGFCGDVTVEKIVTALNHAFEHPEEVQHMARRSRQLFGENPRSGARLAADIIYEVAGAQA
ncbi:MAG: UDP-2,4-diacetamido-2,4,6-trideoxy-beta-L-altropyranose hydrolase [Candidatus Zixiibacteriota bacterium]